MFINKCSCSCDLFLDLQYIQVTTAMNNTDLPSPVSKIINIYFSHKQFKFVGQGKIYHQGRSIKTRTSSNIPQTDLLTLWYSNHTSHG